MSASEKKQLRETVKELKKLDRMSMALVANSVQTLRARQEMEEIDNAENKTE